jgi:hypothetical protein
LKTEATKTSTFSTAAAKSAEISSINSATTPQRLFAKKKNQPHSDGAPDHRRAGETEYRKDPPARTTEKIILSFSLLYLFWHFPLFQLQPGFFTHVHR